MTERLKTKINEYLIKKGQAGKAFLSLATGKSPRMIERYLSGTSKPNQHTAFLLAKECGCSEREALTLASETPCGAKKAG